MCTIVNCFTIYSLFLLNQKQILRFIRIKISLKEFPRKVFLVLRLSDIYCNFLQLWQKLKYSWKLSEVGGLNFSTSAFKFMSSLWINSTDNGADGSKPMSKSKSFFPLQLRLARLLLLLYTHTVHTPGGQARVLWWCTTDLWISTEVCVCVSHCLRPGVPNKFRQVRSLS